MSIKYIHVAGTNGKGSVCAFIADSLIAAGKKTGKFTSPHVLDIAERITINNIPISHNTLERLCGQIDCPRETPQFERLMNAAFIYFAENDVEYAVIETGIGGLKDCTNRITPIISVITKISLDHTEILGETIEEIAFHKAGIIKEGVPVVTDPTQSERVMRVIKATATKKRARLIIPEQNEGFKLNMAGRHQQHNAATAAATMRCLGVAPNFSKTKLIARMEVVSKNPLIIVDGAHNHDGICAVTAEFDSLPHKNKVIIEGEIPCKNYQACTEEIRYAIKLAKDIVGEDGAVLICGSLYLAGEALKILKARNF
ncbi:MAG: Mur ligase family protein [Oscillospiraceae bacterium]|nr:Mur ligase family protein [Oscillospiraceae bacterium]